MALIILLEQQVLFRNLIFETKKKTCSSCLSNKAAGWVVASVAILQIPIWGAWTVHNQPGNTWWQARKKLNFLFVCVIKIIPITLLQRFRASFRPTENWGPKDEKLKSDWIEYNQQDIPFRWTPKFKCGSKIAVCRSKINCCRSKINCCNKKTEDVLE